MLRTNRALRHGIFTLLLAVLLAACAGGSSTQSPSSTTAADPDATDIDTAEDGDSEDDVADHFAGQTIEIVVGYDPGSSQDIEARLIADFLGAHIPGNPSFTTSYQPGAAGLAALEFVHRAPANGLTIALSTSTAPVDQLMEPYLEDTGPQLSFDIDELVWVGSTGPVSNAVWTHSNSGITSVEELTGRDTIAGATRVGASIYTYLTVLREVMDVPMEFVLGYASGSDMSLALLRGEIELQGGNWTTYVLSAEGITDGELIPLASFVADPPQEDLDRLGLDPIPNIRDLTDDPELQSLMDAALLSQGWGRLIAAPPDTPQHIADAIGDAIGALAEDPDFLAERDRRGIGDLQPLSGREVSELVDAYLSTPPATLERVAEIFTD